MINDELHGVIACKSSSIIHNSSLPNVFGLIPEIPAVFFAAFLGFVLGFFPETALVFGRRFGRGVAAEFAGFIGQYAQRAVGMGGDFGFGGVGFGLFFGGFPFFFGGFGF